MLLLCYFYQRNYFLLWVYSYYYFLFPIVAHNVSFVVEISPPKNKFLEVLTNFFRTAELQHKLLILTKFLNIFHWKSAKKKENWMWSLWRKISAKLGPML